jgi:hypothetical protein
MTEMSFYWMSNDGKKLAGPWETHDDATDALRSRTSMVKVIIDKEEVWIPKYQISVFATETEEDENAGT